MSDTDNLKGKGHPSVHTHSHVDIHAAQDEIAQGLAGARVGKLPTAGNPMAHGTGITGAGGLNRTSD